MAVLGTTDITTTKVRNALGENTHDVGSLCKSSKINKWGINRVETGVVLNGTAADRLFFVQSSPYRLGDFRAYDHDAEPPGVYGGFVELGNSNGGTNECTFRIMGDYTIERWVKDWGNSWVKLDKNNDSSWFNVTCTPDNHSVSNSPISGQIVGVTTSTKNNAHILTGTLYVTIDEWDETNYNRSREYRVVVRHVDENDTDLANGHNEKTGSQSTIVVNITPSPTGLYFSSIQNGYAPSQTLTISSQCSLGGLIEVDKVDTGDGTNWFTIDTSNITIGTTTDRNVAVQRWDVTPQQTRKAKIRLSIKKDLSIIHTIYVDVWQTVTISST